MRILKSKSRYFPNRTHPKNNHAFFLRSFVLVVCLLVFLFFLYSHRPLSSADTYSRVIGFPLRKVGAGETTEHFRARTHSRHASLTLAKPLYASAEERAAGSTWVVCLHKGFLRGVDTYINLSTSLSVSATECWPLIMTWSHLWTCGWTRGLLCSSPTQKTHTISCGHTNRWGEWENPLTSGH